MQHDHSKTEWEEYCLRETEVVRGILSHQGYLLDVAQPHIKGERFLMAAVTTTSGRKLILLGTHTSGKRVVIKASKEQGGIHEIEHERMCRSLLTKIDFARDVFHTPEEIAHIRQGEYTINIQTYIEQSSTFLERPIEEQFTFALTAFKGQEGAHATTYKHRKLIRDIFDIRDATTYLKNYVSFIENIKEHMPTASDIHTTLIRGNEVLKEHREVIEQYSGFLTHTDFVPHNFRIQADTMYLLDHSSLTFGNKYEGWARFLNFMTLYNPPLQKALETYVRDNRTSEESVSLRMMRIYRLGELIWYYVRTLDKSTDNLLTLNTKRIYFWNTVLMHMLNNKEVPEDAINTYTSERDKLRSDDEKDRQKGLH